MKHDKEPTEREVEIMRSPDDATLTELLGLMERMNAGVLQLSGTDEKEKVLWAFVLAKGKTAEALMEMAEELDEP